MDGLVQRKPGAEVSDSDLGTAQREAIRPEPGSARWWADRAAADGRRRPRAGGLTTRRIVETALEVLRADGLDALTLRAVAARLGSSSVSNASLYRHIASRDELIVLVIDHLMGEVRLEATGRGWRADIEELMGEMRRVILHQPLPTSVTRSRSAYGPNMLRIVDAVVGRLLDAGLTGRHAAFSAMTMIEFVAGATSIERTAAGRRPLEPIGAAGFLELLEALPIGQFTALRTIGADYLTASADEIFKHGLAIVLDGIESQLPGTD